MASSIDWRHRGSQDGRSAQHNRGKLTAHERLEVLLDEGSFQEVDRFVTHRCVEPFDVPETPGDGVVSGWGKINGRRVCVVAQDFTVLGGSLSEANSGKICKVLDLALKCGLPIIYLNDSGGARIQEGVGSLAGYGEVFRRNVEASGVIPQISVVMGPCAGGAVYSPALTDFVFMVRETSYMFLTGPQVLKTVTNESVTPSELGGADVHSRISSVADAAFESDVEALEHVRVLLEYLPANNRADGPSAGTLDSTDRRCVELDSLVPESRSMPYDMRKLVRSIADDGDFLEIQAQHAENMLTGFIRIEGRPIGVVANQPMVLAGCIDILASRKAARFVRFCDAFSIPIFTAVDVPGFLPGRTQEHGGIIKHGAKLLYAYAEATVPMVSLIARKAYGGAYLVMGSKHLGADITFAWPTAEIAVMGAKGALEVLYRKHADDTDFMADRMRTYERRFSSPMPAAERGYVDDVILPVETRRRVATAFELLREKSVQTRWKKHGNIPL
ncbi:MAG: acyl-CoA carboxylase subunit beta [Alphaproteobacteria bacterium]|mgnify:CR=1 FL=1|nr:acyl-CoA carboxylase subunit beta [Alphaproteobacteria bacterium]MBU1550105.1 acyl-CoA carboxylase subunit beta [Alphaproteobacteria bacterium]MBU2337093.1 acyl-CoA carboxylase subunit beta [Alphaproteobacteria bacterium]MBU2389424.1 acyl-CoA carboxylase subunit beta [Alphaproteobacteria bacterium]